MSTASLSLDIGREAWHLDMPARWLTRFEGVFRHLIKTDAGGQAPGPCVGVNVRSAGTKDQSEWAAALGSSLPTRNSIAAVNRGTEVVHVSSMALDQYDFEKRRGESILLDPSMEASFLGTNLLLRHIAWRASQRSLIPIHAAAVGDGERFWLIPAASGKGKSTTTAAAIAVGLSVLGDDFVLLDPETGVLYSLYQTIRLRPESRRMIDDYFGDHCFTEIAERDDEKQLLIHRPAAGSGGFVKSGSLQGVLLLERRSTARIGSCVSAAQSLRAFSSTFRLLPSLGFPADVAFRAISKATRDVEARTFGISSDLTQLAMCLQAYVRSGQ